MRRLAAVARLVPLALGAGALALGISGMPARAADREVILLPTTGDVDMVMAQYLEDGIHRAQSDGAAAVVVKLNTPGGRSDAMQRITTALLEAPVPVIVWVAPSGGRAASAGTFITLAANLSFMAPATNIGAASPISSTGADIGGTLGVKVLNDAIAGITAIAQARSRPVAWAVSTVATAASYPAADAVAAGAVDGIAATLDDVLAAADGRTVTVAGTPVTLQLAGASVVEIAMNPLDDVLRFLSDPNIAFVLFVVGSLLLVFELGNPNVLTGVAGSVTLILAFIGFANLPLNLAGLLLIAFGLVLVALETQITSHGVLALAATACVAFGAVALYSGPSGPAGLGVHVALPVIVVTSGMTALFGALIAFVAVRSRRLRGSPVTFGSLRVVGEQGKVARPIDPVGSVLAAGEEWSARSTDGRPVARGTQVRVARQDGLTLYVEPLERSAADFDSSRVGRDRCRARRAAGLSLE